MFKRITVTFYCCLIAISGISQSTGIKVRLDRPVGTLATLIDEIEQNGEIRFSYSSKVDLSQKIEVSKGDYPLETLLYAVFKTLPTDYEIQGESKVLLFNKKIESKGKTRVSGYVRDAKTKESLIGVTIYNPVAKDGIITNEYGFFSYTAPSAIALDLQVSFIGYQTQTIPIAAGFRGDKSILLQEKDLALEEVVISSYRFVDPINSNEFDYEVLNHKSLMELPSVFGEFDVIKALQLQSGVVSLGEGSSGLFVQGGNQDQNLTLIDEAPIYNPAHLFGLVSVFNPDAIKQVTFHKGAIPANYGGRLSSVINAQMNDGNKDNMHIAGGIGTLTVHAAIDGPIVKEKASYLIAFRRSIRDLVQNPSRENGFVPQFYDLNTKVHWSASNKNSFFISLYRGKDQIKTFNNFNNTWGNTTSTFRWNHVFSHNLFSNVSLVYSDYKNDWDFNSKGTNFKWRTGIKDLTAKVNLSYFISSQNELKFGVESTYHQFKPGENEMPDQSIFRVNAIESAAYALNDLSPASWLGINYGVRFVLFQNIGQANWYTFEGARAILQSNTSGVYNTFTSLEPRVTVSLKPVKDQSLKLSYAKTSQYSQVLQNSVFSYTSLQAWMPANPNFDPLFANILSIGYFARLKKEISFSLEGYYKKMQNTIDYIDHAELISNPFIATQIRSGTAEAYGVTAEIERNSPKLDLKGSYTYANVENRIAGINQGKTYSALQNIPHDFRVTALYKLNSRINISAFWTYHSGFIATLPSGFVNIADGQSNIPVFSERNASRLRDYHRLDLSVILNPNDENDHKKWRSTWSVGVYNLYGKFNPLVATFLESNQDDNIELSTFYRIIPNISYSFNFQ